MHAHVVTAREPAVGYLHALRVAAAVVATSLLLPALLSADPGTGLIVRPDGSAVFGDPGRNLVWAIDLQGRVTVLVRDRHSHLLRLEPDGTIVGEHLEYIASDRTWRSSHWRLAPGASRPIDVGPPITAPESFPDGMSLRRDAAGRTYSWRWLDEGRTAQGLERRHLPTGRVEVCTADGWQTVAPSRPAPLRFEQITGLGFGIRRIAVAEFTQVRLLDDAGRAVVLGRMAAFPRNAGAQASASYLRRLWGVTVDTAGAVYVADGGGRQVVRLVAGRSPDAVVQLRDAFFPVGVALGAAGLYVLEYPDPEARVATGPRVRLVTLDHRRASRVLGATPAAP